MRPRPLAYPFLSSAGCFRLLFSFWDPLLVDTRCFRCRASALAPFHQAATLYSATLGMLRCFPGHFILFPLRSFFPLHATPFGLLLPATRFWNWFFRLGCQLMSCSLLLVQHTEPSQRAAVPSPGWFTFAPVLLCSTRQPAPFPTLSIPPARPQRVWHSSNPVPRYCAASLALVNHRPCLGPYSLAAVLCAFLQFPWGPVGRTFGRRRGVTAQNPLGWPVD